MHYRSLSRNYTNRGCICDTCDFYLKWDRFACLWPACPLSPNITAKRVHLRGKDESIKSESFKAQPRREIIQTHTVSDDMGAYVVGRLSQVVCRTVRV